MHSLYRRAAAALAAALLPVLATAAPLNLEEALERAVQRSEAARSARAGETSASEAAKAAGQLPDPVLGASLENLPITGPDRLRTGRESMTMKRLALSQEWVSPAKRGLRTAAARAMVAREAAAVAAVAADARLQTALAYVDAFYASAALKLSSANEARARDAADTARARLSAGGGMAQDVLALTTARGMAADESAEIRQQFAAAAVSLARWTGVTVDELSPPNFAPAKAEQGYVDRHPTVIAKRREIELARQEAAVTASDRQPNWTWEVAYSQRSNFPDMVSMGVSIPLPIAPGARQDRQTASKLALVEKSEAELAEAMRSAQAEYRMLTSDVARLQERIKSLETDVLAPARQRTAAATAAYGANQAALSMVFEARQVEFEVQRKLLNLQRDLVKAIAQLNFKPLREEEVQ